MRPFARSKATTRPILRCAGNGSRRHSSTVQMGCGKVRSMKIRLPHILGLASALCFVSAGVTVMAGGTTAGAPVASGTAIVANASAPVDTSCLSATAIQDALVSKQALRLADIRHKLKGDIVRADLCRSNGKLAYLVTVLTPEGGVKRVSVDASSGEMVYIRAR